MAIQLKLRVIFAITFALVAARLLAGCGGGSGSDASASGGAGARSQSVVFGTPPSIIVGGIGSISATGGLSGNSVVFASTTPAICTVSGSTVAGVAVGICAITADQAGNTNYLAAAQVTQSFPVASATVIFSGVCEVQLASAVGYATNVSSAASCTNSVLNVDGYGAAVVAGQGAPRAGSTSIAFPSLLICNSLGTPPSPGATTLTPCKR